MKRVEFVYSGKNSYARLDELLKTYEPWEIFYQGKYDLCPLCRRKFKQPKYSICTKCFDESERYKTS